MLGRVPRATYMSIPTREQNGKANSLVVAGVVDCSSSSPSSIGVNTAYMLDWPKVATMQLIRVAWLRRTV